MLIRYESAETTVGQSSNPLEHFKCLDYVEHVGNVEMRTDDYDTT